MTEPKDDTPETPTEELRELLWSVVQPTPHNVGARTEEIVRTWKHEDHEVTLTRKYDSIEVEVSSEATETLLRKLLSEEDIDESTAHVVGWRFVREDAGTIELRAGRDQLYTAFLYHVADDDEEEEDEGDE